MADIELVIKIPEDMYERAKVDIMETMDFRTVRVALYNGIPLPKGHGRLMVVSEDAVKREQTPLSFSCQNWISEVGLSNSTVAIIEADEKEQE